MSTQEWSKIWHNAQLDEQYSQAISLTHLSAQVSLSPYYLLRAFRAEVGMPPHAYMENGRIRHAQRFKHIIGVTPGQYATLRG